MKYSDGLVTCAIKKRVFFGEMLSQTFVTWKIKFGLFLEGQIGRLDCNIRSANFYWLSQQQLMNSGEDRNGGGFK